MTDIFLTVLIFAAALLYSSVGHGGSSGYLAAMALLGVAPDAMKRLIVFSVLAKQITPSLRLFHFQPHSSQGVVLDSYQNLFEKSAQSFDTQGFE